MRCRGFEPHTERMLNAGNGLQLLNMDRQEPTLPASNCNHIRMNFTIHSTLVQLQLAGERYCLAYRMHPLRTGVTGQTIYILRFRGKQDPYYPTHLLDSHEVVGLRAAYPTLKSILMHDAGIRTRALSLRADTLKRCIDYGNTRTHGGDQTHSSSL